MRKTHYSLIITGFVLILIGGLLISQSRVDLVFGDTTSALNAGTDAGNTVCGNDNWTWNNTGTPGGTNANDTTYVTQNTNRWDNTDVSDQLDALNFGFTGLSGTIDGIEVEVYGWDTVAGPANFTTVQLTTDSGATLEGTNQAAGALSSTDDDVYDTFGGAADNWGGVITAAEAMTTGFGVSICWTAGANDTEVNIDHIRMTITYTPAVGGQVTQQQDIIWFD